MENTQHENTQHENTQHENTQHENTQHENMQHENTQHETENMHHELQNQTSHLQHNPFQSDYVPEKLAEKVNQWAKDHHIDQKAMGQLNQAVEQYQEQEKQQLKQDLQHNHHMENEKLSKYWGEKTQQKIKQLDAWMENNMAKTFLHDHDMKNAAIELTSTAQGMRLLEAFYLLSREKNIPNSSHVTPNSPLSKKDIQILQQSKAYQDNMHPQHQQVCEQVRKGFQSMFPQEEKFPHA